jgi:hypothetical protein
LLRAVLSASPLRSLGLVWRSSIVTRPSVKDEMFPSQIMAHHVILILCMPTNENRYLNAREALGPCEHCSRQAGDALYCTEEWTLRPKHWKDAQEWLCLVDCGSCQILWGVMSWRAGHNFGVIIIVHPFPDRRCCKCTIRREPERTENGSRDASAPSARIACKKDDGENSPAAYDSSHWVGQSIEARRSAVLLFSHCWHF